MPTQLREGERTRDITARHQAKQRHEAGHDQCEVWGRGEVQRGG